MTYSAFNIRKTQEDDIPELIQLAVKFFKESNFKNMRYNISGYAKILQEYIENPNVISNVVVSKNGSIVGFSHAYIHNQVTHDIIGELYQFYLSPDARGTGASRELAKITIKGLKDLGARRIFAETISGIQSNVFKNLWMKFGFEPVGEALMMEV